MKIVVLDGYTEDPGDLSWERLERLGELTTYDRTSVDKIAEQIGGAETVYTNKIPISTQTTGQCPNLEFIGVLTIGYNMVDTAAAEVADVIVSNIPAYGTDTVAQHVIALLLKPCHHIGEHPDRVKAEEWTHNAGWCFWKHSLVELTGKTFGVIGFGRIGQDATKIAEVLGMEVLAYNEYLNKALETGNCKYASLDQLLAQADVIGSHCSLFPSIEGIINRDSIAKMKGGVRIISTSRGPLIVEKSLREALDSGEVSGAVVDVVSTEPIREDNLLLDTKNVIVIPHITWAPRESRRRFMNIAMDNLKHLVDEAPQNVVDK